MPLSDAAVKNAKPSAKPVRIFDGGGLYLEVSPAGGKLWRLKYRIGGAEKRLALGKYPEVTLKDARERRDDTRKLLANGSSDPGAVKQAQKAAPEKHMAAITDPVKFGQLLRDIDDYTGTPAVTSALKLLPLVFCRPGELRAMR
jgi:hypothetical protein